MGKKGAAGFESRWSSEVHEQRVRALLCLDEAAQRALEGLEPDSFQVAASNILVPFLAQLSVIENLSSDARKDYEQMISSAIARSIGRHGAFVSQLSSEQAQIVREICDAYLDLGVIFGSVNMQAWCEAERRQALSASASLKKANAARGQEREKVLRLARRYISENPNTTKGKCAQYVARELKRGERGVMKSISCLFEPANTGTRVREQRPKKQ